MKKKVNPSRATNKRGGETKTGEDVQVTTGLPPKVDGQLRCFCKVSVNQVLWAKAPPSSTIVRVKWWGEEGEGAVFRPLDVKKGNKGIARTTGRYPVRSGPRQFASYLNDMGTLSMMVFTSETASEPVGQAQIPEIAHLSNNRPINGFFPIFSSKNEKIGELQVSVMLEPLMASYDNTGSIPTTDLPAHPPHSQESMLPSASRPKPHSQQPIQPQEDPFISPASQLAEDVRLQNGARAQNATDIRQRLQYDLGDGSHNQGYPVAITTNGDVVGISDIHGSGVPLVGRGDQVQPPASQGAVGLGLGQGEDARGTAQKGDLLSLLVSRGTQLRKAMVASSLNSNEQNNNNTIMDFTPSSPAAGAVGGAAGGHAPATYSPVPGVKVDNLLGEQPHSPISMLLGSPVGKHEWQMLQMLNGASPGPSVCSEGVEMLSEPGDPLHDHTLLQELFYKRSDSEMSELSGVSGDEADRHHSDVLRNAGNMRPPSRSSSFSSLAAALPSPPSSPSQKRKRKSKAKSPSDSGKNVRRSRPLTKERNPRMTKTVVPKKSRSRSRSRSKSRSLSQKRKGSFSDSDVASTPRSEVSRVSFDPAPSDVEDNFDPDPKEKQVDGLSVERLTLLGRIHVARVNVLNLTLHGNDLDTSSSSRASGRSARRTGKPPRPAKSRKPCTYLIEYQFPVVATSRDKYSPNAMATEVMRVASKAVSNGVISFSHRSVFPLMFDGAALEKWWKSALVFKVYSREAGQKSPVLLGSCGLSLKSILKSDDLHLTRDLEIRDLGRSVSSSSSARNGSLNSSRCASGTAVLGSLKVSVELASDHKDFATSLARTRVAEMSANSQNIVPVIPPSPPPVPPLSLPPPVSSARQVETGFPSARPPSPAKMPQSLPGYSSSSLPARSQQSTAPVAPTSIIQEYAQLQKPVFQNAPSTLNAPSQSSEQEALALHTLVLVPEGCNISLHGVPPLHMVSRNPALLHQQLQQGSSGRDQMTRNTYLVCRMFWSNDSVHSNVCWGTLNPQYDFSQVAPVLVTQSLLERMRNNYMVIEVWDKKTTAENDKLIGICKLSLHQFFMSFRDKKISAALMRSEYPVVAIDNYMPVVDPFSGLHFGQLSVLLAMGSAQQVACLQRLKSDRESGTSAKPQRPGHFLERQDVYGPDQNPIRLDSSGSSVEHVFEVVVQGVRGLKLLDTMIWGEADCFVQYFFPAQGQPSHQGPTVLLATPTLRSFRTATTLCIPDPTFHDVTRHRITLQGGTPVQRELLTACANSSAGSGGLPFEVWCRFYHPNVRDQVIARTTLPLAKLCAMVTMQKRGESSVQSFSLPLTPVPSGRQDDESQAKMKDSGLMDVTVHYKTQVVESGGSGSGSVRQVTSGSQVCLCISIIRASGLQAAAEWAARTDSGMQYPAEVGVNSYVRLRLSFLGNQEERVTKTVARAFSPEWSHHMELPLQLLWSGDQQDSTSLAQVLETGHLSLQVWHQVPTSISPGVVEYECDEGTGGKRLLPMSGDVLLATCSIPLTQLLIRQSGIKGWFSMDRPTSSWAHTDSTISAPEEGPSSSFRLVGGVEVGVHFAHSSDRQKVVESARSIGWSPVDPAMDLDSWQEEDTGHEGQSYQVSVKVDQVCVPLSRVLLPGQTALDPTARCYVRYKFYDRAAVVSRTSRLQGEGERLQATVQHRHTMVLPHSAPFLWYLREEHLEVQVWVTYGSHDKGQRPLQRDKLVGTAYVDLLPLCDSRRPQHRISGLLPLFKPGTSNLAGAFLQLHLTSNLCHGSQVLEDDDEVIEKGETSEVDYDSSDSFHQLVGSSRSPVKSKAASREVDTGPVFTVHLSVERALHLPTVRASGRTGEIAPTTYISFQSAEKSSPTYSDIVPHSTDPVWDYTAEVALSAELLTHNAKNLVLKVWHKPEGVSKQPDKSCDRVLGFVSVDLCPLNSGLRQICGWYNIVDLSGQSRGQIKVSITPVDLAAPSNSNAATGGVSLSMLSSREGSVRVTREPVAGFSFFPTSLTALSSLPASTAGTTANSSQAVLSSLSGAAPAHHWQPRFLSLPTEGAVITAATGGDSSKSMLFSSLRQQLRDLDGITQRLRMRLSLEESDIDANQPASARSADILTGTHSGLSTINTTSSLTATREVLSDVSRQLLTSREITADSSQQANRSTSDDNLSHNAVDSGAFSGNNTGKSQDGPDSQRSEKQVAFGERKESAEKLLSALPTSGTSTCAAEEQFLEGSPQGALTPRDFSSNSQTSQGFQPLAAVPSESTASGSAGIRSQEVPVLTHLTEKEEITPRPEGPSETEEKEDNFPQDYHHQPADYNSDDQSEDDEMFGSYHHYRAMLDQEEAEIRQEEEDENEEEEGSNVEFITPRRINDVSGMWQQFAHAPGTLPPIFSPLQQDEASVAEAAVHTWPGMLPHRQDGKTERPEVCDRDEPSQEEESVEEEMEEKEETKTKTLEMMESHERNSFINSWLEESQDPVQTLTPSQSALLSSSFPHRGEGSAPSSHRLDLDLAVMEAEDSTEEENTPRVNGATDLESLPSEEKMTGSMHLLSQVELIDTLTSVNMGARQARGQAGHEKVMANRHVEESAGRNVDSVNVQTAQNVAHLAHPAHLLSNVELYSTVSSLHPASAPPRHLLSNVELASSASGSSHHPDTPSSRPSRQSSATSGGQRAELEACAEHSEEEAELGQAQPLSSRSDEVSKFFAPSQNGVVVNGAYDSSEEELEYQFSAAARVSTVRARGGIKGRAPCQSITVTTEDSGLESGAKSSQDEREALSLLDSTQGQGLSEAAAVPEFFLRTDELQASMRALQLATSAASESVSQRTQASSKAQASADLLHRLKKAGTAANKFKAAVSVKGRPMPTAEEAKRIAKIFSTKPS